MNTVTPPEFETLAVRIEQHVAWVALNRPEKSNAMNDPMWVDLQNCFDWIDSEPVVRVVVLCGEGKNFCSGIDLASLMNLSVVMAEIPEAARKVEWFRRRILELQGNLTAIENCRKPVIAAIQGSCVGGGVDMITTCDMRYCTEDARFSIKEVDVGLVADVGTLQRLPKIISPGIVNELAYSGRYVKADEAVRIGLVNASYPSYAELIDAVSELAQDIARKSPLVLRGIKEMIRYTRDHSVQDSLNYVATWNAGMLSQEDVMLAIQAGQGEAPDYKD
ncbi:crotonase/enoyl-CoA hydratase family protein [Spongiibacter sp. KMU-158]|uniref:Crotonase/enoyl-CoA hydratase family protein n=1 Tax=Spongiibacter pelagi TaxID=2760804 RepID=A0A927C0F8_9GAMM|nr:crotonase/enoyl-CoA hydratase family protein [Spongiibacter pelagi]MBD2858974.1 crotonase/enoyl-CoA hydratase family protein [Spongiibacter pelagi]